MTRSGLPRSLLKPVDDTDNWATDCAQLEQAGTRGYFLATVRYAEKYAEGWSQEGIAEAVTAAGFPIAHRTVGRRLKALEGLDVTSEPSTADLERFAAAYVGENNPVQANNSGDNEWYTPVEIIQAAVATMGGVDLDPASTAEANEVVGAAQFFTEADDGLAQPWSGRVWMNPPYAQPLIGEFCSKLVESYRGGGVTQAISLTNNGTETAWYQTLAEVGGAFCFPRGRVRFWSPDKDSATPLQGQALVYLGLEPERFRGEFRRFGVTGVFV